mgnify:CR=1 FL=1
MKPNPLNEGKRWLRQAEEDLSDVRSLRERGRHHLACFMAQQAAEKALKAYLYAQGAEAPWGHSVADLAEAASAFDQAFTELKWRVTPLDQYYIPTRYPNSLPGGIPAEAFTEHDSQRALNLAEDALRFVAEKLST